MSKSDLNPTWVDSAQYPFSPKYFRVEAGEMHYIDEGSGDPIVFVHGNPDWSFSYRKQIKALLGTHRCIAADHIGSGLSDKPAEWSYLPSEHAKNFSDLMDYLDLQNITLVVNDWGGPIALSYAIAQPERVKKIVLINTWLWSVEKDWYDRGFSGFAGGPIGRFLNQLQFLCESYISEGFRSEIAPHPRDSSAISHATSAKEFAQEQLGVSARNYRF